MMKSLLFVLLIIFPVFTHAAETSSKESEVLEILIDYHKDLSDKFKDIITILNSLSVFEFTPEDCENFKKWTQDKKSIESKSFYGALINSLSTEAMQISLKGPFESILRYIASQNFHPVELLQKNKNLHNNYSCIINTHS